MIWECFKVNIWSVITFCKQYIFFLIRGRLPKVKEFTCFIERFVISCIATWLWSKMLFHPGYQLRDVLFNKGKWLNKKTLWQQFSCWIHSNITSPNFIAVFLSVLNFLHIFVSFILAIADTASKRWSEKLWSYSNSSTASKHDVCVCYFVLCRFKKRWRNIDKF